VPFDTTQPGARRLLARARQITADLAPVTVEIRKPVLLLDEGCGYLVPGQRATVTARSAGHLVEEGSAVLC
jgi:hypothetical protein